MRSPPPPERELLKAKSIFPLKGEGGRRPTDFWPAYFRDPHMLSEELDTWLSAKGSFGGVRVCGGAHDWAGDSALLDGADCIDIEHSAGPT